MYASCSFGTVNKSFQENDFHCLWTGVYHSIDEMWKAVSLESLHVWPTILFHFSFIARAYALLSNRLLFIDDKMKCGKRSKSHSIALFWLWRIVFVLLSIELEILKNMAGRQIKFICRQIFVTMKKYTIFVLSFSNNHRYEDLFSIQTANGRLFRCQI